MRLKFLLSAAIAAAGLLVSASAVRADSIIAQTDVLTDVSTGHFVYDIYLTSPNSIQNTSTNPSSANDFFAIIDFNGLTGTPTFVPAGVGETWNVTTTLTTTLPNNGGSVTVAPDSASVPDINVEYTGGAAIVNNTGGNLLIGVLTADSTIHDSRMGSMAGSDTQVDGSEGINVDPALVPAPAPASLWGGLGLLGLMGVFGMRRRMKLA